MEEHLAFLLDDQRASQWDDQWMVHLMVVETEMPKEKNWAIHFLLE